jgi:hypothetical protein
MNKQEFCLKVWPNGLNAEGYRAFPGSKEFLAWKHYYLTHGPKAMANELTYREIAGKPFEFGGRWPPQ